jgi:hypothetical protein
MKGGNKWEDVTGQQRSLKEKDKKRLEKFEVNSPEKERM